ncbi:bacterial Ig-like domain-containing protein [Lactococcus lactis]|uniref:bacterial Ig-like domain-containing protein n=1 Tax=Lactococcus lactis TaxID=1358 RepID=UPI001F52C01F|nr:bacterial Ig-like domain-containing protein [Lactococcus lactis]MCI1071181.1 bacterial Ig-like domain-containing protein [Lactococcus lactis]
MKKIVNSFLLGILLVMGIALINVKTCEAYEPGGVKVKLLPTPKPTINADVSNIYSSSSQVIPVFLQGTCDNSDTSITDFPLIAQTGLSFICDVNFSSLSSEEDITPETLKAAVDKGFALSPSSFKLTLDNYPGHDTTIVNTNGFNVVNAPSGEKVLRITMRGDSETGVASMLWNYIFDSGLPKDNVPNHISMAFDKHVLLSAEGLPFDESPNKVNTKGWIFPSQDNKIVGKATFYDWDQCQTEFLHRSKISLIDGAKPSNTMEIDIPTWSTYISPWDSKNEYNIEHASFDEVKGVNTQLPGGYLTPTIQWNLRKDGFPTAEMVAKRFGRVVNIFNKTVDTQPKVQATAQKTSQGENFILSSSEQNVLQRPITLQTLFKAEKPQLLMATMGSKSYGSQQPIDLKFSFDAPTSQKVTLWESVDQGDFKQVQTYDLSDSNESGATKEASLPPINQTGKHTLRFKLTDSNDLESNSIDSIVTIDQRELKTQNSVIYQYNPWDKSSNILTVTDRDGNPVKDDQVIVNGEVDTKKVGVYPLTFTYDGMVTHNEVKVLETKSSLDVQDIVLTVGDSLDISKGFLSATDNAGNPLKFDKVSVLGADKVDTHKVGDYSLTYSLKPISPIEKVVQVHVKSGALTLSSLPSIDFNNIILNGSSQTSKPKIEDISLNLRDRRGLSDGWDLQASYLKGASLGGGMTLSLAPTSDQGKVAAVSLNGSAQNIDVLEKADVNKPDTNIILNPTIDVPAHVTPNSYTATIVWNLQEVPAS